MSSLPRLAALYSLLWLLCAMQVLAQDSHYATFIPSIPDQTGLPIDSSLHTVGIEPFTSTNSEMGYEIVHSFDSSVPGAPEIEFEGDGPSLTIAMNDWSSKFTVGVVYRDLNTPSKSYGCSFFSVEPAGRSDADFCSRYGESCYCTVTCIVDVSEFCQHTNYIPGTQADFTITVDQGNAEDPQEILLAEWDYSVPELSASCGDSIANDVALEMYSETETPPGWISYTGAEIEFDASSFVFKNKMVDTAMAGEVLMLRVAA